MDQPADNRTRLIFALGLIALFAILVGVVVIAQSGGGDEDRTFAAAPAKCIESWNSDADTVSLGQHQAVAHGYSRVEVAYATGDGSEVSIEPIQDGSCALLFAASQLDSELAAAALIERRDAWEPMIATGADAARLDELQDGALEAANAELGADGRLSPL